MEAGKIIKGHVNEMLGLNKSISEVRLEICHKCPLFKNTVGGICNPSLWVNPETDETSTVKKDGYFKGCGCRLKAKTTLNTAHCPAHKW